MEKPIRMRVRRTCHECNATFGQTKECPNCQHTRCRKCTRYPPKRSEAEREAQRERVASKLKSQKERNLMAVDYDAASAKMPALTKKSKTGGLDLVHKKPRQRVRRNCCGCEAIILTSSKKCPNCEHDRCTDCPREP